MTATFLLAADHGGLDLAHARELLGVAPPSARACYIGAAHGDHGRWARGTAQRIATALGMPVDAPRLSDAALDVAAARIAIATAHVLFLDGGDTLLLVEHARARGLDDAFRSSPAPLVLGVSAGACAVAPFTVGYAANGDARIEPCLAMGFPAPLDVHSEDDDWTEMRTLLELARARPELSQEGVVIPARSALLALPSGELRSRGAARSERRALDPSGAWRIEPIAR